MERTTPLEFSTFLSVLPLWAFVNFIWIRLWVLLSTPYQISVSPHQKVMGNFFLYGREKWLFCWKEFPEAFIVFRQINYCARRNSKGRSNFRIKRYVAQPILCWHACHLQWKKDVSSCNPFFFLHPKKSLISIISLK